MNNITELSIVLIGPPDIIAPNSTTVDVAVNNRASLFCKSVSYPDSSTSWMHYPAAGGDQLGRSVPGANTRFVINSSEELVITSAAMEDAGAFQCNVTNEHGSATINITLIVVGMYNTLLQLYIIYLFLFFSVQMLLSLQH